MTIQEVDDAYGVSKSHLMKVAFELGRSGYVETVRRRNGGIRLARDPKEIGLGNVLRRTEENFTMVECFDSKSNICVISRPCRLRGALARALQAYLSVLDEYTLADLIQKHPVLSRMLKTV